MNYPSIWAVTYIHEDEPKTRVNPDGTRTWFMKCEGSVPLRKDFEQFKKDTGYHSIIELVRK